MMPSMRKSLIAVAFCTLLSACWLTVMSLVLRHPGYGRQAIVFALFVGQSAVTLAALMPGAAKATASWIRPVVLLGAVGILYSGWMTVAEQLSRSGIDPAQPQALHFEGYALLIGLALAVQGILTFVAFLPTRFRAA